jgi:hypothetical protein
VSEVYRPNDRRVIRWLLLGLLGILGALYVASYCWTGERIPSGTSVDGIRIGGLLTAAAEHRLETGLGGRAAEPIMVTAEGRRATFRPSTVGLG